MREREREPCPSGPQTFILSQGSVLQSALRDVSRPREYCTSHGLTLYGHQAKASYIRHSTPALSLQVRRSEAPFNKAKGSIPLWDTNYKVLAIKRLSGTYSSSFRGHNRVATD